jgi:hypothetical protein
MTVRPSPSGLKLDASPAAFAAAMSVCQHAGGFCCEDGYCHYGNRCFRQAEKTAIEQLQKRVLKLERQVAALTKRQSH